MDRKNNSRSSFWLVGFGVFVSIVMIAFYIHTRSVELEISINEQISRSELVKKKLDQFVVVSDLLSKFIQEDIRREANLSKNEIERKLHQYLSSGPADIIYGVGIWYEPFKFEKNLKLFGPYVHRSSVDDRETKGVITYEWSTSEYNYPNQEWYKNGFSNNGESYFVNPYFDNGLVYITNSRVFYGMDKVTNGIISVDLVLPQLQNIIKIANQSNQEIIYIIDRSSKLLGHPFKDEFFKIRNIVDGKDNQSLLNYTIHDVNQTLQLDHSGWVQSEILQKDLGWKIIAITSKKKLLAGLVNLERAMITAAVLLWFFIMIAIYVLKELAKVQRINEDKIETGRAQLLQASKMASLGEMAGGIAHEINNPLAIISSKVSLLKRKINREELEIPFIKEELEKIDNTVQRISKIILGLRSLTRDTRGDSFADVIVENAITDALSLCSEKFKSNDIKLELQMIPNITVLGNSAQISQVMLNLLNNAFDAVSTREDKWVMVTMNVIEDKIRVVVSDSGAKIPPEIASRIMDPFYTTKEVGKGTGLGLSISKSIIEHHHGRFWYDETSSNTSFIIEFPMKSNTESA